MSGNGSPRDFDTQPFEVADLTGERRAKDAEESTEADAEPEPEESATKHGNPDASTSTE